MNNDIVEIIEEEGIISITENAEVAIINEIDDIKIVVIESQEVDFSDADKNTGIILNPTQYMKLTRVNGDVENAPASLLGMPLVRATGDLSYIPTDNSRILLTRSNGDESSILLGDFPFV